MKSIRVVLALVFAMSAGSKSLDFSATADYFSSLFGLDLGVTEMGLGLLILLEAVLAVEWLLASTHLEELVQFSAIVMVLFTLIAIWQGKQDIENCGCFGTEWQTPPIWTLVKNGVLLVLLAILKNKVDRAHAN